MSQQQNVNHLRDILIYLREGGQRLDTEIGTATGIALADVRAALETLSSQGDVVMCHTTRFAEGRKIEGLLCRATGLERKTPASKMQKVKP